MKIREIRCHEVDLRISLGPYRSAKGSLTTVKSTILAVETDTGLLGWGEVCPFGANYLPALPGGVQSVIEELAPALIGQDPRMTEAIHARMDAAVDQQLYVKTGIDYACWDILGQDTGLPIYALLGGMQSERLPLIASVPGSVQGMTDAVEHYRRKGYRQFSLHIAKPDWDDFDAYRETILSFDRKTRLIVDANRSWNMATALEIARAFDDLPIFLEQPVYDIAQLESLRPKIGLPLIADEVIVTTQDIAAVASRGIADAVALKIGRVGGLSKARRICDIADVFGIPYWIKDVIGAEIATVATAHLAHARDPKQMAGALSCTDIVDTVTGQVNLVHENGEMFIPGDKPGLGFVPDASVLGEVVARYR